MSGTTDRASHSNSMAKVRNCPTPKSKTTDTSNFFKDAFQFPSNNELLETFTKSVNLSKDAIIRQSYYHQNSSFTQRRVKLINLKTVALNGKYGICTKLNKSKGRFKIILDDTNQSVGIKPENIEFLVLHPDCLHWRCSAWNLGKCSDCRGPFSQKRLDDEISMSQKLLEDDRQKALNIPHNRRIHSLGIRVEALIAFAYAHDCWDWTTRRVVRDIIVPATRETRCRFGELPEMSNHFGKATVFASHCWGARFGDLVGAACHGARKDRIVWIDIFAVRQWPGNREDLDFASQRLYHFLLLIV